MHPPPTDLQHPRTGKSGERRPGLGGPGYGDLAYNRSVESLEPRNALPLTDEEIRELYIRGVEILPQVPANDAGPSAANWPRLVDWALFSLVSATLLPVSMKVMAVMLVTIIIIAASVQGAKYVGPFSRLWLEGQRMKNLPPINVNDSHVLSVVVKYLTRQPIAQFQQVEHNIRVNRTQIATSIQTLSGLIDELFVEGATGDDTLSLLRKSRLDQAERSKRKLEELDIHLAAQLKDAEAAVAPIREMERHFHKMLQISDDLSKIQTAHGLIEDTEANIAENRLQIQLLRSISQKAMGSLHSIEQDVKARELAENEVLGLRA